jgi:hypothetical protein
MYVKIQNIDKIKCEVLRVLYMVTPSKRRWFSFRPLVAQPTDTTAPVTNKVITNNFINTLYFNTDFKILLKT